MVPFEGAYEVEVPANQPVTWHLTIANGAVDGPPLVWTASDVVHGTEQDFEPVTESPAQGTLEAGESHPFQLFVQPLTGPATYAFDVRIDSNDPERPRVVASIRWTVVAPVSVRRASFGQLKARYRR